MLQGCGDNIYQNLAICAILSALLEGLQVAKRGSGNCLLPEMFDAKA